MIGNVVYAQLRRPTCRSRPPTRRVPDRHHGRLPARRPAHRRLREPLMHLHRRGPLAVLRLVTAARPRCSCTLPLRYRGDPVVQHGDVAAPGRRRASRSHWWSEAAHNTGARDALLDRREGGDRGDAARARARHARLAAPCSATGSSAARRSASSSCCRSRCPASSPASRCNSAFRQVGIELGLLHADRRPRHVLHRRRLQQRAGPAAAPVAQPRGGLGRPRRRPLPDLPLRDVPADAHRAAGRRAAGLRPQLRRDRRHHVHRRRRHRDAAAVDPQQLRPRPNSCRS